MDLEGYSELPLSCVTSGPPWPQDRGRPRARGGTYGEEAKIQNGKDPALFSQIPFHFLHPFLFALEKLTVLE